MSSYGYDYNYKDYSTQNGVGSYTEDWSKTSHSFVDHVCRPVLIDAEGRKRPIISYSTPNNKGLPTRVEPVQTHDGVVEEKWGRPSSPIRRYEPQKVNEFINTREKWSRPSSPVRYSEPDKVNKFINDIHMEASRPTFGPLSATNWHQTPRVTTGYGYGGDFGDKIGQTTSEPVMITSGGWSRPSHATLASPLEGSLTKPTNNINTAMEYFLESAKPSSGIIAPNGSRGAIPVSTGLRTDAYTSTIDSREAARRYSNSNFSSRNGYPKNEAYTRNIDGQEAARKYSGLPI